MNTEYQRVQPVRSNLIWNNEIYGNVVFSFKFATDNFLICLSYAKESSLIVQNVNKLFRVHTSCRRIDSEIYSGSAFINVNIKTG